FNKSINSLNRSYANDFIGFAPVFKETNKNYISSKTNERSSEIDGKYFSELLFTEKEIKEISKLFQENNKTFRNYLNEDASENNFKKYATDCKYIHLSTHGFADESNTLLSGLAFYNSNQSNHRIIENREDGLLYSGEIACLDIDADLLVLSSCEGGLGRLVKGEGLIAVSRNFSNTGIPNIMYSLWNVNDKSTSEFMIDFYKQILSGKSYSESMQEVKLKMIKDIDTCYPKIWSSFVLIGI
ncbi:CHAT domain-containing protein, partial [Bacteroidota bacterium]